MTFALIVSSIPTIPEPVPVFISGDFFTGTSAEDGTDTTFDLIIAPPPLPPDPPPGAIISGFIFFFPPPIAFLAAPLTKLPPTALASNGNAII